VAEGWGVLMGTAFFFTSMAEKICYLKLERNMSFMFIGPHGKAYYSENFNYLIYK
jgi:hypothetical protein